jgi:hypothetical protein
MTNGQICSDDGASSSATRKNIRSRRNAQIDLLRGLTIWIMLFEHLPNSCLNRFTPFNLILSLSTCSDVFVLLSGYVSAIAFGKTFLQDGFVACWCRALRRCFHLYVWNFGTLLLVAGIVYVADAEELLAPQPDCPLLKALVLLWKPAYFDILTVYILWVATIPFILLALRRNAQALLATSIGLYTMAQIYPGLLGHISPLLATAWVDPLAWQILFCVGMWLGFRTLNNKPLPKLQPTLVRISGFVLISGMAYRLVRSALKHNYWGVREWLGTADFIPALPAKFQLSPFRLIWFAALVILVLNFRAVLKVNKENWLTKCIVRCGQQSLNLYCVHVVLIYGATILAKVDDSVPVQIISGFTSLAILVFSERVLSYIRRRKDKLPQLVTLASQVRLLRSSALTQAR